MNQSFHPLVQVDEAFELLRKYSDVSERNLRFNVTCGAPAAEKKVKGIYLRELHEVSAPSTHTINVEPLYMESIDGLLLYSLD